MHRVYVCDPRLLLQTIRSPFTFKWTRVDHFSCLFEQSASIRHPVWMLCTFLKLQNVSPADAPSWFMTVGNNPSLKFWSEQELASGAQMPTNVACCSRGCSAVAVWSAAFDVAIPICCGMAIISASHPDGLGTLTSGHGWAAIISESCRDVLGALTSGCGWATSVAKTTDALGDCGTSSGTLLNQGPPKMIEKQAKNALRVQSFDSQVFCKATLAFLPQLLAQCSHLWSPTLGYLLILRLREWPKRGSSSAVSRWLGWAVEPRRTLTALSRRRSCAARRLLQIRPESHRRLPFTGLIDDHRNAFAADTLYRVLPDDPRAQAAVIRKA